MPGGQRRTSRRPVDVHRHVQHVAVLLGHGLHLRSTAGACGALFQCLSCCLACSDALMPGLMLHACLHASRPLTFDPQEACIISTRRAQAESHTHTRRCQPQPLCQIAEPCRALARQGTLDASMALAEPRSASSMTMHPSSPASPRSVAPTRTRATARPPRWRAWCCWRPLSHGKGIKQCIGESYVCTHVQVLLALANS